MKNGIISKSSGLFQDKEGSLINLKHKSKLFRRIGRKFQTDFEDVQETLSKEWYFVTKIVLTYCEKKMF